MHVYSKLMTHDIKINFEIKKYLTNLIQNADGISAIWIFGSRTRGNYRTDSDWDIFIMKNQSVLTYLQNNSDLHRPDIDIFVGESFEQGVSPWKKGKNGKPYSVGWTKDEIEEMNSRKIQYQDYKSIPNEKIHMKNITGYLVKFYEK